MTNRQGYRTQDAVDLVISKQDALGRWTQESRYCSRFAVRLERKGMPSKWLTLNAMRLLKAFYG